ncbi:hypothetical protein ACJBYW_10460, partial [Streptococcus suis]
QKTQKIKAVIVDGMDKLTTALGCVEEVHFSMFPFFCGGVEVGVGCGGGGAEGGGGREGGVNRKGEEGTSQEVKK